LVDNKQHRKKNKAATKNTLS